MRLARPTFAAMLAVSTAVAAVAQDAPSFKAGVELINVTATVTDDDGRFVPDLTREDFSVFEDGQPQEVTYFESERVPVSLGILLDVSGSMTPDKMASARGAIDHLVLDLLGPQDELFFMQFATRATVLQEWTTDRPAISRAVRRLYATGGTAMYDAIADALPIAAQGMNRKKALLVISDGNDTNSLISSGQLRQMIRESEVLVYALGVDGTAPPPVTVRPTPRQPVPQPFPFPIPTPGRPPTRIPLPFPRPFPQISNGASPQIRGGVGRWPSRPGVGVNGDALRVITDDTGGRTEIVRGFGDLNDATARIADELSKQYSLGYVSTGKRDGKWHAIKVTVKDRDLNVRARRGYVADQPLATGN